MDVLKQIDELAGKYFDKIVKIRRHLHEYPELSFQEFKTSAYIQSILTENNIPFKAGYVKTGILGILEGKNPKKKIIALRGDMDALPVEEQNELSFKSKNKGVMHACGHDVHTSSLLGTALILNELKESFEGTILLIFQPAEEKLPGGAKLMMEEGVFDEYEPELIIGQHVMPNLPAGKLGFKTGMYMASTDEIYLTIKGKGGHAAMPHQLTDTVLMTAQIIVALQQVASRKADAAIPTVLSFGKISANGATNVIPDQVDVEGTFRTMDENWRTEAHKQIKKIASSIAEGMGGTCEVEIKNGYPYLVNNEEITMQARQTAVNMLGEKNVVDLGLRMTAEDFAYFSQKYPSTFYRLGIQSEKNAEPSPLHSPGFMVDEKALKTAMNAMAGIAIGFLQ